MNTTLPRFAPVHSPILIRRDIFPSYWSDPDRSILAVG
jgi:hypothetical protein